jgi:hypothetical protein
MDISTTLDPRTRRAWRAWLEANHARCAEIWLLLRRAQPSTGHGEPPVGIAVPGGTKGAMTGPLVVNRLVTCASC